MLIYVSGPMSGLPDLNFPAFREATSKLRAVGYDVRCPTENGLDSQADASWEDCLRRDLRDVLDVEGVALLDGWWRSKGAHLEVHVARALGVPCEPVDHWLTTRETEAAWARIRTNTAGAAT